MSFDITKLVDPPMPSYTFALYSRDLFEKSKFKDYDSLLENKIARSQARAKHLAWILESGNVTRPHESKRDNGNVPKTTSVQFLNAEYIATFNLGTDDHKFKRYLLVDTGSDLVWWQCGPCSKNKCYEQKNEPLYDLTKSRTYQKVNCRAQSTKCLLRPKIIECSSYENTCVYDYNYEDGGRTKGWIAEDVITFVLDQKTERILFGCGRDQTSGKPFDGDFSGIAGLGRRRAGGYSLPSQFGADIMAICLPDFFTTGKSTISFHISPFKRKTSAKLLPNPALPLFYFVNLFKVFINDKEVPLPRNIGNDMNSRYFVDTGATFSFFPKGIYKVFRDTFRKEAGFPLYKSPPSQFDTCYKADPGVAPDFPTVKMYFGQQKPENLLFLAERLVVVHQQGLFCLAFMSWKNPVTIIGSYQLQGVGLTFDTATDTLSFDIDACGAD
uniref:Aspartyl protease family protein n=2 Tax=Solanum tuberosum TaxID=4113 RepID=M1DF87_SOLTU